MIDRVGPDPSQSTQELLSVWVRQVRVTITTKMRLRHALERKKRFA